GEGVTADGNARAGAFLGELQDAMAGGIATCLPNRLLVFGFENATGDPGLAWIGVGLAESVADKLGRVDGLMVTLRARLLQAQHSFVAGTDPLDVGQRLGHRWVLSGRYAGTGAALQLSVRLAGVATGGVALDAGLRR